MNLGQAPKSTVMEVLESSQRPWIATPKQLQAVKNCALKMEEIFKSSKILRKIWIELMDGKKMVVAMWIPIMDALGRVEQLLFHEQLAFI